MNTNKKYILLSLVTMLTVTGVSIGALSLAQTVSPLACSVNAASVGVNQAAILTATGGNGTYSWSGTNLNVTNSGGTQFAVSYPQTGTYPITVASGGLTATCNVVVTTNPATTGNLACFPAVQNVTVGQTAVVSATGGDGVNYTWSAPDLTITNPNGSGFSATYGSVGLHTLTVTSAGLTTTCAINVLSDGVVAPAPVTPGLPDTGGGYGQK
jgi:PKD domain